MLTGKVMRQSHIEEQRHINGQRSVEIKTYQRRISRGDSKVVSDDDNVDVDDNGGSKGDEGGDLVDAEEKFKSSLQAAVEP